MLVVCLFAGLAANAQTGAGATIVLPGRLLSNARATLAVLDASGRLVPGAEIEFSGGKRMSTDATGRLVFPVPDEPGVLRVSLAGQPTAATATVLEAPATEAGLEISDVQQFVPLGERFAINGQGFRGAADENRVLLGGQPAIVLAASPLSLVCIAGPKMEPGPTKLAVEAGGGKAGPAPVTLVRLEISSDVPQLKAEEHGHLIVRVRGTAEPVEIEARSLNPTVVRFLEGSTERETTKGGEENTAAFEMVGISGGDFSVEAHLVPGVQGLPDTSAARQELQTALPLAPAEFAPRLEKLIEQLEKHPEDSIKVRDALEKMLGKGLTGDFARHVEAAWKILLRG